MNAMADSPYRRAAAVLAAWQCNARGVLQWAHPSWLASALAIDEAAARALTRAVVEQGDAGATRPRVGFDACSLSLLRSVGPGLPELDAFADPGAMRLDAAPPEIGLRVLRIRALRFRRGEIRRIVDKRTRASVVQFAGIPLERLTGESPNERLAVPDIGQMSARVPIPPVAMLDGDALALEGHALIKRDLRSAGSPCPLLRLALPRDAAGMRDSNSTSSSDSGDPRDPRARRHWVEQIPADVDQHGSAALFAQLPNLLPEWAWLFG